MSNKEQKRPVASSSNRSQVSVTETTLQQTTFRGPIPHPDLLKGYNEIVPGAAERILAMAEDDAAHQRSMEVAALEAAKSEARLGQWLGFFIGMAALGTSLVALFLGSPWVASILGGTTVIGLVSVFVVGRLRKPKSHISNIPQTVETST